MKTLAKFFISYFFLFQFFFSVMDAFAQGIKGRIVSETGDPLSYCSVFVKITNDGIPTNEDGLYSMPRFPGQYNILVQHLSICNCGTVELWNCIIVELSTVHSPQSTVHSRPLTVRQFDNESTRENN